LLLAELRLGLWEGCCQHEACYPFGRRPADLHHDLTTHRKPCKDGLLDAEMVEQCNLVAGEDIQRRHLAVDIRRAVTAQVGRDNVPTQLGDRLELGLPHRMVEGMTVYQEQRLPAAADLFESEIDSVQEGFLHRESRREMWGAKLSIDPSSVQSIYCTRCNLPITSSLPMRLRETSVRAGSVRAIGYRPSGNSLMRAASPPRRPSGSMQSSAGGGSYPERSDEGPSCAWPRGPRDRPSPSRLCCGLISISTSRPPRTSRSCSPRASPTSFGARKNAAGPSGLPLPAARGRCAVLRPVSSRPAAGSFPWTACISPATASRRLPRRSRPQSAAGTPSVWRR